MKEQSNVVPLELTAADGVVWVDVEDMLAKTRPLTRAQRNLFFSLWSEFLSTSRRLPFDNDKEIAKMAGVSLWTWRRHKPAVMRLFRSGKPIIKFRWTSPYE